MLCMIMCSAECCLWNHVQTYIRVVWSWFVNRVLVKLIKLIIKLQQDVEDPGSTYCMMVWWISFGKVSGHFLFSNSHFTTCSYFNPLLFVLIILGWISLEIYMYHVYSNTLWIFRIQCLFQCPYFAVSAPGLQTFPNPNLIFMTQFHSRKLWGNIY